MAYGFQINDRSARLGAPPGRISSPIIPSKPTNIPEWGGPHGYPTYDYVYHSELNQWVWQRASTAVISTPSVQVFPAVPPPVTILPGISNIPNTNTLPAVVAAMDTHPTSAVNVPTGAAISTTPIGAVTPVAPVAVIDTSTGVQVGTVTGLTVSGTPVVTPTVSTPPPGGTIAPILSDITGAGPSTTPDWITAGVWVLGGFILWSTFRSKSGSTHPVRRGHPPGHPHWRATRRGGKGPRRYRV